MLANTNFAEQCEVSRIYGTASYIEMVCVVPRETDMGFCTGASFQSCSSIIGSDFWLSYCNTVYR